MKIPVPSKSELVVLALAVAYWAFAIGVMTGLERK